MSNNKNFKHPFLTVLLIILIAVILGGAGSLGYNLWKHSQHTGKSVIEAPIIGEIGTSDENSFSADIIPTSIDTTPVILSASTADVSSIVDAVMPSVVSIDCITKYTYYSFFGIPQEYETPSSGTGFIIAADSDKLYVLTNNHVIDEASSITVNLNDGSSADAEIVGTDAYYDLAVISVSTDSLSEDTISSLRVASIGDSDSLRVGDMTIAIGNALGYGQSTTVGYVSALDRNVTIDNVTKPLIQTDTAINPGNSGGPLLNIYGQVIGINSVKYTDEKVEGMCYAIPMSGAIPVINDLIQYVTLDDSEIGFLGIQGKDVSSSYSYGFGMPEGIYIYDIVEGSPADNSELCIGDIITAVNGRKITSMEEFKNRLSHIRAGSTITLTVSTLTGGRYIESNIDIVLGKRPKE